MEAEIRPRLPAWLGVAVEPVLAELLPLTGVVPFEVAHRGRQWDRSTELDAVMLDRDRHRAWIAEVKWTRRPVPRSAMDDLRSRARRVKELSGLEHTYALVSRAGFTARRPRRDDERFIDVRKLELSP